MIRKAMTHGTVPGRFGTPREWVIMLCVASVSALALAGVAEVGKRRFAMVERGQADVRAALAPLQGAEFKVTSRAIVSMLPAGASPSTEADGTCGLEVGDVVRLVAMAPWDPVVVVTAVDEGADDGRCTPGVRGRVFGDTLHGWSRQG